MCIYVMDNLQCLCMDKIAKRKAAKKRDGFTWWCLHPYFKNVFTSLGSMSMVEIGIGILGIAFWDDV